MVETFLVKILLGIPEENGRIGAGWNFGRKWLKVSPDYRICLLQLKQQVLLYIVPLLDTT
jgi:hypothetical protein